MKGTTAAQGAATSAPTSASDRPALRWDVDAATAVFRRDLARFRRDRSRWIGLIAQPLMFWVILGQGFGGVFRLESAPELDYAAYFFPGAVLMAVVFTAMFSSLSVVEDRQNGLLRLALVGPGSATAVALGKLAAVVTLASAQGAVIAALAPVAGYSLGGAQIGLTALAIVLAAVFVGAASLAAAWVFQSTHGFHAVMSLVLIPAWVLSGAVFPAPNGPMGYVVTFNPLAYAVDALSSALGGGPGLATGIHYWNAIGLLAAFAVGAIVALSVQAKRQRERP